MNKGNDSIKEAPLSDEILSRANHFFPNKIPICIRDLVPTHIKLVSKDYDSRSNTYIGKYQLVIAGNIVVETDFTIASELLNKIEPDLVTTSITLTLRNKFLNSLVEGGFEFVDSNDKNIDTDANGLPVIASFII